MTLVIAKKIGRNVSISSDSRISFGSAGRIDFGIKVFSIPVKIYSPTDKLTNITKLVYDHHLGMGVIGSTVNAYTVKESIYEILQNLQYLPTHTDVSMYGIGNLVFKVYKKVVADLKLILGSGGLSQIVLAGYCPLEKKIRTFEFTMELIESEYTAEMNEILQDSDLYFYGSGKEAGEQVASRNPEFNTLQIIRDIINNGRIETVGGGLQHGEFDMEYNFRVFGVEDYELNSDGSFKQYNYTLRGMNLYQEEFERDVDGFHISYQMKRPFTEEINKKLLDYIEGLDESLDA